MRFIAFAFVIAGVAGPYGYGQDKVTSQAARNNVLGSVTGTSSSQFGAGSTETHYENINGIKQKVTATTSYEQKADGSCVRRVVEEKNGVKSETEDVVDCEQAKEDVKKQNEETQQAIQESSQKLNKEIQREQKRIQDSINKQMKDMNKFFK